MEFQTKSSCVIIGRNKSSNQVSEIETIMKFYKSREEVIKFYSDYFKMVHMG